MADFSKNDPMHIEAAADKYLNLLLEKFGEEVFLYADEFESAADSIGVSAQDIERILAAVGPLPNKADALRLKTYPVRFHYRTMHPRCHTQRPISSPKNKKHSTLHHTIPEGKIKDKIEQIRSKKYYTPLTDISPHYLYLLLRFEDPLFFSHKGISLVNIFYGFASLFSHGKIIWGGSTITQQLAKTLFFNVRERTLSRKLRELPYTFFFEKHLSKLEILELYVNSIEYGNGNYSIYEAAREYFDTEPKKLSFGQSLLLCSIIPGPGLLEPKGHPQKARARLLLNAEKLYENYLLGEKDFSHIKQYGELQDELSQNWFEVLFKSRLERAASDAAILDCSPLFLTPHLQGEKACVHIKV